MKEYKTANIRNIALVSHNGAGKSTFVERLLFDTGVTTRMGSVQQGTAAMDFEEEEVDRNSSIATAIAPIEWKNTKVNFLDTPGYADFVGEVFSALQVSDGALILVEAVAGAEVGTELVWQYCEERSLPRIVVINKMDRENVRVQRVWDSTQTHLPGNLIRVQLPIGEGPSFKGVVDLISMKAIIGPEAKEEDIPADMADAAEEARFELVEVAAEGDDELLMKYFDDEELTPEEVLTGLKAAMRKGTATPVFFSAPEPGIAVSPLMNCILRLMPSPDETEGFTAREGDKEVTYPISSESPLAALIFKTREDPYGKMSYLRVFGGTLHSDTRVYNANQNEEVRVGHISVLRGKEQISVQQLHAGDIGAVVKLGDSMTNDTLCEQSHKLMIPPIKQPEPIMTVAVHPVSQSDVAKLSTTLSRLTGEDPTLRWHTEPATREVIIAGMGNAHLDIAVKKAHSKFGLNLTTSIPKIPYRETITRTNSAEYTHKKQTGGAGQYARVFLRLESLDDDAEFEFKSEIFGGSISQPFVPAVEKGCRQAIESGVLAGFPMTGVRAVVYDGKEHPVDSKEIAFQIAGREGFKKAAMEAAPILLEPIYEATVSVPNDYMGDIMGDLNSRRARVLGMDQQGTKAIVRAEVPLAEMQTYSADLRSMTQGRGVFSMSFVRYGRLPSHMQEQVVAEARRDVEHE